MVSVLILGRFPGQGGGFRASILILGRFSGRDVYLKDFPYIGKLIQIGMSGMTTLGVPAILAVQIAVYYFFLR